MFSAPGFLFLQVVLRSRIHLCSRCCVHNTLLHARFFDPNPALPPYSHPNPCFLVIFCEFALRRWALCERFVPRRSLCLGSRQQRTCLPHSLPRPTGHLNIVRRWASSPSSRVYRRRRRLGRLGLSCR
ncbi:hypothetical protein BDV11DRAFT_151232 [Aspergillus similis]